MSWDTEAAASYGTGVYLTPHKGWCYPMIMGSPPDFYHPSYPDAVAFSKRVKRKGPTDCWPYITATKSKKIVAPRQNRPRFWYRGRYLLIQRLAYALHKRDLDDLAEVDTTCTSPTIYCCNPAHLRITPPIEMSRRAIDWTTAATPEMVTTIRLSAAEGMSYKQIAILLQQTFGRSLSIVTIGRIVNRKVWKDLP